MYKVFMVWERRELDDPFPIREFGTEKEANSFAKKLNKKENTQNYFVAETVISPGIVV